MPETVAFWPHVRVSANQTTSPSLTYLKNLLFWFQFNHAALEGRMPRHNDAANAAPTIKASLWASVPERSHITSTEEFRSQYMCQPVLAA